MLGILPLILGLAPEIARWIGGSQAAGVTSSVVDAVRTVTGEDDPVKAAAVLTADPVKAAELRVQLATIAANAETAQRQMELDALKAQLDAAAAAQKADLESFRVSVADIGDARKNELELAKSGSPMAWGAPIVSGLILFAFGVILYVVLHLGVVTESLAIGNVLLGTLAAMASQVGNFWLGSSSSSARKDDTIQNAQTQLANSVPVSSLRGNGVRAMATGDDDPG